MMSIFRTFTKQFRRDLGDKYANFSELSMNEKKYSTDIQDIGSPITIMAIHGGKIEPGTSAIAKKIAGNNFNYYCFNGEKPRNNWDLHISSYAFDEPYAIDLVKRSELVVTIHGCLGKGNIAYTGGDNYELRLQLEKAINDKNVQSKIHPKFHGEGAMNICNKGTNHLGGVQFELTGWLRCFSYFRRRKFINSVRQVLLSY